MKKYYVEIVHQRGGACVFAAYVEAWDRRQVKTFAWEMADIAKDDRYLYDMYIEIL